MMVFTYVCWIVAALGVVAGTLMLGSGIQDAINLPGAPWQGRTGVKLGAETLLVSIALGTLAEISFSVRKT